MALKKLHSLLIRSFLPPFAITLFVSVFLFFLVQIVITYLDDFIGKGLSFWTLTELFSLAWVTIIPQCIPLAVLLASIMTIGSLAENYELAAMKSAGLSLFNIIRPLFALIVILGLLTFVFNNYIIPKVTLKFSTLLYDIRSAKPAMNIKEGIFYNKINGDNYSLRVGKKNKRGGIEDVIIYDHSSHAGNNVQLYADSGAMNTSPDTNYLVITLYDGNHYKEENTENNHRLAKPMSQLNFKELTVNIELTDFKLKRSDEKMFKGHYEMMNVWQIDREIDTFELHLNTKFNSLKDQAKNYFFYRTINYLKTKHSDTVNIHKFYDKMDIAEFKKAIDNALNNARSSSAYIDSVVENTKNERQNETEYKVGWHEKINVSFACIVLFFVGAPLGAIIRKGGLGMPVVVSVLFFLAYYIFSETFKSLTLEGVIKPWPGLWMPLFIFLPLGIFLTYKAATDSALFDIDVYLRPFRKLFTPKS